MHGNGGHAHALRAACGPEIDRRDRGRRQAALDLADLRARALGLDRVVDEAAAVGDELVGRRDDAVKAAPTGLDDALERRKRRRCGEWEVMKRRNPRYA